MNEQFNAQMTQEPKKTNWVLIILMIIIIGGLCFGAGFMLNNKKPTETVAEDQTEVQTKPKEVKVTKTTDAENNKITTYEYGDYVVKVTDYEGGADQSSIVITNASGNVLYEKSGVKTLVGENFDEVPPTITEGKLSFVALNGKCYAKNGENLPYIDYITIDLDASTINATVTKTTQDYVEGYIGEC